MLAELYTWWTRQMADLADPLLRRVAAAGPDGVLVRPDPAAPDGAGGLTLLRRRKGRLQPLAQITADADAAALQTALNARRRNEALILCLPRPPLIREVTLPIAAETDLDRVLQYEMDGLTPFTAEDVCHTYRIQGHDRTRGLLRVELAIVPRAWITAALQRLAGAGIAPAALESSLPDGRTLRMPIGIGAVTARRRIRSLRRVAAIACVLLACAVVANPVVRQSIQIGLAQDRIEALRPRVEEVEALRRHIAASHARAARIATAHQRAAGALTALGLLTDALADDTWLSTITLRQRRLILEGRSATVTKLIGALAADPHFHNPAFAATVLHSNAGTELFTIQVDFAP